MIKVHVWWVNGTDQVYEAEKIRIREDLFQIFVGAQECLIPKRNVLLLTMEEK